MISRSCGWFAAFRETLQTNGKIDMFDFSLGASRLAPNEKSNMSILPLVCRVSRNAANQPHDREIIHVDLAVGLQSFAIGVVRSAFARQRHDGLAADIER